MFAYEWDPEKARSNRLKHGISFAEATAVLEDAHALTIEDEHPGEQRFITLGMDTLGRVLVVVFTSRPTTIRIISARKATPGERGKYEEGLA
jgi:uncharacterized DUF497 family protein